MGINMLLKIRAEPEIDRDCWEIERLSINISAALQIQIMPKDSTQKKC